MLLCKFINTMIEQGCKITECTKDNELIMRKEEEENKYILINFKKASVVIYIIDETGKDKIYADSLISALSQDEDGNVCFNKTIKEPIF